MDRKLFLILFFVILFGSASPVYSQDKVYTDNDLSKNQSSRSVSGFKDLPLDKPISDNRSVNPLLLPELKASAPAVVMPVMPSYNPAMKNSFIELAKGFSFLLGIGFLVCGIVMVYFSLLGLTVRSIALNTDKDEYSINDHKHIEYFCTIVLYSGYLIMLLGVGLVLMFFLS